MWGNGVITTVVVMALPVWWSTDQNVNAFKEVAIIRHPRIGEYAIAFITSAVTLQVSPAFASVLPPLPH